MHMKFQVFISTGGISETIFIVELQSINYRLISISLEISLYQVQMILFLIGTVNVEKEVWLNIYLPYQIWQGLIFNPSLITI